jgi:D-glycero-D-manno-heptose 1,7-bisphosphate phosphatase
MGVLAPAAEIAVAVALARRHALLIFDADDTLRRTLVPGQPCPHADHEWELLPGVARTLRAIVDGPGAPHLGLASNQDHVGHGLLPAATAHRLLQDVMRAAIGRPIDDAAVRYCPHPRSVGCDCHKPAPGLLLRIMAHYGVPPTRTLFIGNAVTDREAAARAGVGFAWAGAFFGGAAVKCEG